MGFWDSIKELGSAIKEDLKDAMDERAERIRSYREKYETYDDETLLRFYRNTSRRAEERMVILKILRERGYGVDND